MTMTADAQTLREIAERLEKLTGPSPQMDAEIFAVAVYRRDRLAQHPLRYTASIDAMLTLVPGDRRVALREWDNEVPGSRGPWRCVLPKASEADTFAIEWAPRCNHAVKPEFAIGAAALRALAASQEQRRG